MKKILAIFCVLAMTFSFTACAKYDTPENALKSTMDKIISGKIDTLSDIFNANLTESEIKSGKDENNDSYTKVLYKSMTYKIIKTDENMDSALVSIEVNTIDMAKIMNQYMTEFADSSDSSNSDADKWIEEQMTAEDAPRVTLTADVPMLKNSGKWEVDSNGNLDSFTNVMSGGVLDALNGNGLTSEQ